MAGTFDTETKTQVVNVLLADKQPGFLRLLHRWKHTNVLSLFDQTYGCFEYVSELLKVSLLHNWPFSC